MADIENELKLGAVNVGLDLKAAHDPAAFDDGPLIRVVEQSLSLYRLHKQQLTIFLEAYEDSDGVARDLVERIRAELDGSTKAELTN